MAAVHAGQQTLRVANLEHVEQVLLARTGSSEARGKGKGLARPDKQRRALTSEESVSARDARQIELQLRQLLEDTEKAAQFTDPRSELEDSEDLQHTSMDSELEDTNHDKNEVIGVEKITVASNPFPPHTPSHSTIYIPPSPPPTLPPITKNPPAKRGGKKKATIQKGKVGNLKSSARTRRRRRATNSAGGEKEEGEGSKGSGA